MDKTAANNIWIISEREAARPDLIAVCNEKPGAIATEFTISELAQYLLNPNTISIEEKIVGCRVFYSKPPGSKKKGVFSRKTKKVDKNEGSEEILSASKLMPPSFKDEALNRHFTTIKSMLMHYEQAHKRIADLNESKIEDIKAVCEDLGGNRYQLNLKGSIKDKKNYVLNSLSSKTRIALNRSYLLNGLFELRGFRFESFNPAVQYRLVKFHKGTLTTYYVLNRDYKVLYRVDDQILITYMHLFEQSIRNDNKMKEALLLCNKGGAVPLKLFFLRQMERNYSGERLPVLYKQVFNTYNINENDKETITNILNNNQRIVVFNYVPQKGKVSNKLFTNISVMHEFKALEPIKSQLPDLYSEIDKKASVSDAGKLYLLESMRGYQNV